MCGCVELLAGSGGRQTVRAAAVGGHPDSEKARGFVCGQLGCQVLRRGHHVWGWDPKRLLEWHREKAGTIEAIHDVLKNELAAGVLPCGRFGANAAWLRLAVLTHNVITALKRMALPESYLTARPKRLRFLIFNTAGRILHHARRVLCRIAGLGWRDWIRLMPLPTG